MGARLPGRTALAFAALAVVTVMLGAVAAQSVQPPAFRGVSASLSGASPSVGILGELLGTNQTLYNVTVHAVLTIGGNSVASASSAIGTMQAESSVPFGMNLSLPFSRHAFANGSYGNGTVFVRNGTLHGNVPRGNGTFVSGTGGNFPERGQVYGGPGPGMQVGMYVTYAPANGTQLESNTSAYHVDAPQPSLNGSGQGTAPAGGSGVPPYAYAVAALAAAAAAFYAYRVRRKGRKRRRRQ